MYMPSCSLENFWKLFLVLIGLGIIEYEFINSDLKENLLIRFSYNNGTKNEIETNGQFESMTDEIGLKMDAYMYC